MDVLPFRLVSSVVPRWWKALPVTTRTGTSLSSFKKFLKTQIFKEYLLSSSTLDKSIITYTWRPSLQDNLGCSLFFCKSRWIKASAKWLHVNVWGQQMCLKLSKLKPLPCQGLRKMTCCLCLFFLTNLKILMSPAVLFTPLCADNPYQLLLQNRKY